MTIERTKRTNITLLEKIDAGTIFCLPYNKEEFYMMTDVWEGRKREDQVLVVCLTDGMIHRFGQKTEIIPYPNAKIFLREWKLPQKNFKKTIDIIKITCYNNTIKSKER